MPSSKIFHITVKEVSQEDKFEKGFIETDSSLHSKSFNYSIGRHIFSIIIACIAAMSVQTTIPRHNSILQPTYWFEVNVAVGMGSFIITIARVLSYFVIVTPIVEDL